MVSYVHDVHGFVEGDQNRVALLGCKGASLSQMAHMGLPVPPGFTITTEACGAFLATGELPADLETQVREHLRALESAEGKRLGQVDDPLLLSVRSGTTAPMRNAMETILNIGLNDLCVLGLAKVPERERFAWDSYRRLVQMLGSTVMGVDRSLFEGVLRRIKEQHRIVDDSRLDTCDLIRVVETFKDLIGEESGTEFPQAPAEQLRMAILAVFRAWKDGRTLLGPHRKVGKDGTGGAVALTVQRMVFGNLGTDSGSGVAYPRDPDTGRRGLYGDYLPNAQGREVVSADRDTLSLQDLATRHPAAFDHLRRSMEELEAHHHDLGAVEFTIEHDTLWLLNARVHCSSRRSRVR
ncbi:PEP/pyruvate-binding domain-containing protein [Streptomyces yangpuensis]|uniref:PEP/pyruvate-binding domain-containing protein n=1 Tax=Streptomyces yangpuensis TaxID=1648182 RepID=UPI0035E1536A